MMRFNKPTYEQHNKLSSATLSTACTESGSLSGSSNHSRSGIKRKVCFEPEIAQVHEVECYKALPKDEKRQLWFESKEMSSFRKAQIKELKAAQAQAGEGQCIETSSDTSLSWRGFEDIQQGFCRVSKSAEYTSAVVRHYCNQVCSGYTDDEELRQIARGLSKVERMRVRNLAVKDAKIAADICGTVAKKSTTSRRVKSFFSGMGSSGSLKSKGSSSSSLVGLSRSKASTGSLASLRKSKGSKNSLANLLSLKATSVH